MAINPVVLECPSGNEISVAMPFSDIDRSEILASPASKRGARAYHPGLRILEIIWQIPNIFSDDNGKVPLFQYSLTKSISGPRCRKTLVK